MPNHLSYRSGNPVLTSNAFNIATDQSDVMTINGTVNKTFLLLFIVIASGYFAWNNLVTSMYLAFPAAMMGLVIAFLILILVKYKLSSSFASNSVSHSHLTKKKTFNKKKSMKKV